MSLLLVLVSLVAFLAFSAAIIIGIVYARRQAIERETRTAEKRRLSAASTSLGRELFERALRIDGVGEEVRQARTISAGSFVEADIEALCRQIETDAAQQHDAIRRIAPLDGRAREIALARVDPAIAELETAGSALRDLTTRLADEVGPAAGRGADLERRAQAIRAAIDELDELTDISYDIEDVLPRRPELEPLERPGRDREPPTPAGDR